MSWFPNPDEQSSIAMKWFEAKIQQSSDSSVASAAAWASGCRLMRAIKHNYSGVCKILDRLCEQLKSLQQTNQPKRKRNRTAPATAEKKNRTDPAASIHKEADRHLEPSSSEQHLKSVTALPVASEGDHDVTDGLDTDASRVEKSIDSDAICSDLARGAAGSFTKSKAKKEKGNHCGCTETTRQNGGTVAGNGCQRGSSKL